MGINWDSFLEPPDDPEIKVSGCAACGDDLMAGEEVVKDWENGLYFCDMGCAGHFERQNPEMYPEGVVLQLVTLEEPEPAEIDDEPYEEDDEP